jgi:threonine/homoserine/homoserine lactone efflux protein
MIIELEILIYGILLGLFAASSPGPLFILMLSETLRYGKREGIKIAVSPLITDIPIFLFVFLVLSNLMQYDFIVSLISLFGAFYLIYLGIENLKIKNSKFEVELTSDTALRKGVITNFLNPSPYLFWLTIGGPTIIKSLEINFLLTILFVIGFYLFFIGLNLLIVLIFERSKPFIKSSFYIYTVKALGIALLFFALLFIRDGLKLIGILV